MKTIVHLILLLIPVFGFSQPKSTFPGIAYTDFGSFDMQGDKVIFTGDCGQVWHSTDLGKTMQSYEISTLSLYESKLVPFDPENRAIIVAFRDVLLYDFEDGVVQSFKEDLDLISESSTRFVEMDEKDIYLFTNDGIIHGKVDDYQWSYIFQDTSETDFPAVTSQADNYIFIGMGNGRFLKFDKTTNEVSHQQDFGKRVSSLNMVNDNLGYAVVQGTSEVMKTTDGWDTFEVLEGMPEAINPIGFGDDIVITVNTNRIYVSKDGGQTSTYIDTKTKAEYSLAYDAQFNADGVLFMVGEGSMFLRSDDFGESFTHINPYNRSDFYDVTLASNGEGYAVGGFNTIVKTNDNGSTWANVNHANAGEDHYYYFVETLNDNKVFVGGGNHCLLLENDVVTSQIDQGLTTGMYNAQNNYLIAIGDYENDSYPILKSIDNGLTWTNKATTEDYASFVSQGPNGRIYIPVDNGDIMISDDAGETWTLENFYTERIREITFYNDNLGLAIAGRSLLKTIDGGQTYEEIANGYALSDARIINEEHYIYTPRTNSETNIRETVDGGETFKTIFDMCSPTNDIAVTPLNQIIVAHEGGHINLVALDGGTNTIEQGKGKSLSISPNPINLGQRIQLDKIYDEVNIYNLNGALMNKVFNTDEVSTASLYPGTFVIRAKSSNSIQVKMLVVI